MKRTRIALAYGTLGVSGAVACAAGHFCDPLPPARVQATSDAAAVDSAPVAPATTEPGTRPRPSPLASPAISPGRAALSGMPFPTASPSAQPLDQDSAAQLPIMYRSKDGKRAQTLLAEWPYLQAAFDHIAPLAPGYPRLAKGSEFTGHAGKVPGADEQFLLLGVCPAPAGEQVDIINRYLLGHAIDAQQNDPPTHERFLVDAQALTVQCPRFGAMEKPVGGRQLLLPDGGRLSHAYSLSAANDPVGLRGAVVTRDKDGQIADVELYEIPRPKDLKDWAGRFLSTADRKVLPQCDAVASPDGTSTAYVCDVAWSDRVCDGNPERAGGEAFFEVSHDYRITISIRPTTSAGTKCKIPE